MRIFHATLVDMPEIMAFINSHWKHNHILARDSFFFAYQYYQQNSLNFIIARDIDQSIKGILGYIRASEKLNCDVWLALWKTIPNSSHPMLGISILEYLRGLGFRHVLCLGTTEDSLPIYEYLGFTLGHMSHYIMRNPEIHKNEIALFFKNEVPTSDNLMLDSNANEFFVKKIDYEDIENNFQFNEGDIPFKDAKYISLRFETHPVYNYIKLGIYKKSILVSIIILRKVDYKNSCVLRIVDFYGDETFLIYGKDYLLGLMKIHGAEYMDFLCHGLDDNKLKKAGFRLVDYQHDVVPNYFEPFVQQNIKVGFLIDKKTQEKFRCFKADGDQDRPN